MILIQLTDLHVRPRGLPALRACETNTLTERALRAVRDFRPRADALVITGDLTNNGLVSEYRNFADMLARLIDIPVYVIPGNHDDRDNLREALGHLPGVTSNPDFVQYAVDDLPVRLVMLDTLIPGRAEGELCPRRLEWLDAALALRPEKPTIIGMHHPPFLCGIRHMDGIILRDPAAFQAVVAKHPQVQRIICGHHHRVITANVAHAIASIGPGVAHIVELDLFSDNPGAWTLEPPAFQVHIWIDGTGIVSHTAFVEHYPGPFPFVPDPA
jgi:3',5'-cyclic AMP phosphodiesterase CpdA